jgi:hypothetical protein
MKILKKTSIAYENTFVDARGAKKLELAMKPDLIAAGINEVIGDVSKSIQKKPISKQALILTNSVQIITD